MPKGDKYYIISNKIKDRYNIPEEYLTRNGRINKKKKEKVLECITDEEDKKEYMDIFGINININEEVNDSESNSDLSDEQVNDIVEGENNNDNSLDNDNNINIDSILKKNIPRPLLKWVGGKGQIIDVLFKLVPKRINNYYEMFVGGGSFLIMILWAKENGYITINGDINIYDLNEALIGTYNNIKNKKDKLYDRIHEIEEEFNSCKMKGDVNRKPINKEDALTSKESYYYYIRKLYNELSDKSTIESSSYFIFLNKTGFRGMYREGPNGYNIPYGNYKNPNIIDKDELNYISDLIKDVNFYNYDFSKSFKCIEGENNFIYLDPPYAPENDKSFVGYTKDGFDINQHKLLFNLTKKISEKNMIMMSNANVKLIRDNLSPENYKYNVISCKRSINARNPAAKTDEVIITNY